MTAEAIGWKIGSTGFGPLRPVSGERMRCVVDFPLRPDVRLAVQKIALSLSHGKTYPTDVEIVSIEVDGKNYPVPTFGQDPGGAPCTARVNWPPAAKFEFEVEGRTLGVAIVGVLLGLQGSATAVVDYDKLLAEHGDSPRALDWSRDGQLDRFAALLDVLHVPPLARRPPWTEGRRTAILDVGCGLGHLASYIHAHQVPGSFVGAVGAAMAYTGVDISANMVEFARARARREGLHGCEFRVVDAFGDDPLPEADFVVASGIINVEHGWRMPELLRRCYVAARVGCAVNMLSDRAPSKRAGRIYHAPEYALTEALSLTPIVSLRHDYRTNDLTVYLHRPR